MKTFMLALASILFLQAVSARSVALDAPAKKTCEDYLSAETCTKLRQAATALNENVQLVNDAVVEAYMKHKENAQDMVAYIREYLVKHATNFKCEDVLTADLCKKLVDVAAKFKVSAADLLEDIKEAVADGKTKGIALYQKAVEIMLEKLELAKKLTCQDLFDDNVCAALKKYADQFNLKKDFYMKAAIDAYAKGMTSLKDIIADLKKFIQDEVTCEKIFGRTQCERIRSAASFFGIQFNQVINYLKEKYANGMTNVAQLIQVAFDFIRGRLTNDEMMQFMDFVENY